jgi:hypothetical protein
LAGDSPNAIATIAIELGGPVFDHRPMTDDKLVPVKEVAEAVAAIVKEVPVYPDAIQPAMRELGPLAATPLALLNTALRPVRSIMLGINLTFDRLDDNLRKLLEPVPPEQVVEPPASVAGPLLLAYPFVESEPELREMFARLLATAMTSAIQSSAHPGFVEIIKQLTADEAKLLHSFTTPPRIQFPAGEVHVVSPNSSYQERGLLFGFTVASPSTPDRLPAYVHNLARLGLVELSFTEQLAEHEGYAKFETAPVVVRLRDMVAQVAQGESVTVVRGVVKITPFGFLFMAACVDPAFKLIAAMAM